MDHVTDFCVDQRVQKVTALYMRTQGVQKARQERITYSREY
jgi:hypothetical protein